MLDIMSYMMGKQSVEGGGGDITVEALSVTENNTYTAPSGKAYSPVTVNVPNSYSAADEGKVVSNGELVAQTSDTVTQNGTVDTTLINSLLVNVPGLDYDIKEVTVSGNKPTVDRAFDDFILIAQCQKSSIPAAADRSRLKSYFLMFAYVNEHYIPTGSGYGFAVATQTAGNATLSGSATGMSSASIGATSITFTTHSTFNMQNGEWDVLQIELPSNSPIYAFADL